MSNDNLKFGILKCRDLVQLYYGARMVVNIRETSPLLSPTADSIILQPDPRRIRYEILIANFDSAAHDVEIGSQSAIEGGVGMDYEIAANSSMVIERSFLSDMDAVTLGLSAGPANDNVSIDIRETFLTPIPADEEP